MTVPKKLPAIYKPYENLKVCSNTLIGGGVIFDISGEFPLLIGRGAPPLVWLTASASSDQKKPATIVDASTAKTDAAVVHKLSDTDVVVFFGHVLVLSVKKISNDKAEVDKLDLRPFGYKIFGDSSGLSIGDSHFSRNTTSGTGAFIKVG